MELIEGINYRYGMGQMAPDPILPPYQEDPDVADEDEDDDPHDSRPDRTETKNKKQLDLLKKLSKLMPDNFIFIKNNTQRALDDTEASPKIKINPDLTGSWLVTPAPANDLDSCGLWPANTKFPGPKNNQTPIFEQKVPGRLPAAFEENKLKTFITANKWDENSKPIRLHPQAFEPAEYKLDPSNPASTLDFIIRQGFLDNLISDEVFSMEGCLIDTLINNISNNAGHMDLTQLKKVILDELDLIRDVHKLGSQTTLRQRNSFLASLTRNKISSREAVLKDCSGPSLSRETVKGSSLYSPELFGDLPNSFLKKLDDESSRKAYQLKVAPSKVPVSAAAPAFQRSAPSSRRGGSFGNTYGWNQGSAFQTPFQTGPSFPDSRQFHGSFPSTRRGRGRRRLTTKRRGKY